MSEAVQKLLEALRVTVQSNLDAADELARIANLAEQAEEEAYAAALYRMARTHQIKALEFQGTLAAARVEYGAI